MQRWNPDQPPEDGRPPQEVRWIDLRAEPWPEDGRRIRVSVEITPFLERPDLDVQILDAQGSAVASISIIESIDARMTFTMHIRGDTLEERYNLTGAIRYADLGIVDQKNVRFETRDAPG